MSSGTSILQSIIQAVNPKDRACAEHSSGLWKTENILVGTFGGLKLLTRMLFVGYSTGVPSSLVASIVSIPKPEYSRDLLVALRTSFIGDSDLLGCLRCFRSEQVNIRACLVGWKRGVVADLSTNVYAIKPKNLIIALRAQREGEDQFREIIRGWWTNEFEPPDYLGGNLKVFVQPYVEAYLTAELKITQPRDLSSYIKVWPYKNLQTNIYGWAVSNLAVWIAAKGQNDLIANIGGHYPADLCVIMKAVSVGNYSNISSNIITWHIFDINSSINCFNVDRVTLGASISSRPIHLLNASIVGWAHRDLYATINAIIPAYYLRAMITAHGGYKNLTTYISGLLGTQQSKCLGAEISGWQHAGLLSSIFSIKYVSLRASINSVGGAKNLKADIKVREIIFNEFYKFSTANTSDLRVYIGFSLCTLRTPRSAYASLVAAISSIPTYDLRATIEGVKVIFNGIRDLGVLINYTNKYSILSKFLSFKISTSVSDCIRPSPVFFKNSLNITFKIINGQVGLKALITSQPHNLSLNAIIHSRLLIIHGRSNERVLTEEMIEIDNYRKRWSAYIDVYLNTEKPIYYAGGRVFAKDYGEPIISFLFKRSSSLGIKHEYNLRHDLYFDSTDAAIRYGLVKTSGNVATSGLVAKINSIVKNLKLNVKIQGIEKELLYTDFPFTYLKSGSLSTMGTCINYIMYKSKSNIFGGIQDMSCNISAIP